jgi:hypothetical protein
VCEFSCYNSHFPLSSLRYTRKRIPISFNIVKYRVSESLSARVEIRIYVRAHVTMNESVSGFCLGGNAKFHHAGGLVANGTKPGLM